MNNKFEYKKKYGQNFIKDVNIINRMVDSVDIDKDTLVVEVGPGEGILTAQLAKKAKEVIAYEIDTALEGILKLKLNDYNNVNLIFDDFISRNINEDIKKHNYKKLYFIANIPYYVTNSIIAKIIENNIEFDKVVIMVQKEVGERFSAKTKTRAYGALTVYLKYNFEIKKLFDVSKDKFYPVPKVDSVVVLMEKKQKLCVENEALFFKLVKDAFIHKRKILKNNLFDYNQKIIEKILVENNLSLNNRAEEIELDIFVKIANALSSGLE